MSLKIVKHLDPRRYSLQGRLTFFFAVSTTAILFIVSLFLYDSLRRQFQTEDEMELMQATKIIGQAVHTLATEKDSPGWRMTWEHTVDSRSKLFVRVFSPDGKLFVETPNMPPPSEAFPPVIPPEYWRWQQDSLSRYLLTSFQVEVSPNNIWRVEAAYNLTQSRSMLKTFKQQLALILIAALIVTLTISWGITYFGLRPLRRVNSAIHSISPDNLSHRIGDQPWPKELMLLAKGFDDMLSRLEAAFAQLSRFSADLAHEVRTPINNMLTAASVTSARERDVSEYQATLESIMQEGEHLVRLVESMLFLARTENAKDDLQTETLSVADEFLRQVEFFEPFAAEHEVALDYHGDAQLNANPELLRRALSNLLDNAIRHTMAKGTISLAVNETQETVDIHVKDTGVGIEANHLSHIFERFYRVDVARSKRTNAGLGLSLVQSIVNLHGGEISVQSTPGQGTDFLLSFPKMTRL